MLERLRSRPRIVAGQEATEQPSPMLARIAREQRLAVFKSVGRAVGRVVLGTAAAAALVAAAGASAIWYLERPATGRPGEYGCNGDLDCIDGRYFEEHPEMRFAGEIIGEADGCEMGSLQQQLANPLCCPGVSADPRSCPRTKGDPAGIPPASKKGEATPNERIELMPSPGTAGPLDEFGMPETDEPYYDPEVPDGPVDGIDDEGIPENPGNVAPDDSEHEQSPNSPAFPADAEVPV